MNKPSAKKIRDSLLKVLGASSSFKAGESVSVRNVVLFVCQDLDILETSFGVDASTNIPKVRLWVGQAFRQLRLHGYTQSEKKGLWALTERGVVTATLLCSGAPVPVDEDPMLEPDPPSTPTPQEGGVSWMIEPRSDTYNPDPYINALAAAQTKCYGYFSDKSKVCSTCGIAGSCGTRTLSRLEGVADKLTQKEQGEGTEDDNGSTDSDDIDNILNIINDTSTKPGSPAPTPPTTPLILPADSRCSHCGNKVAAGETGNWVRGEGVYHIHCFDEKYSVK